MLGRPKKRKRKKEVAEGKGGKKPACAVREFKQKRCGNCGNLGHNKRAARIHPYHQQQRRNQAVEGSKRVLLQLNSQQQLIFLAPAVNNKHNI